MWSFEKYKWSAFPRDFGVCSSSIPTRQRRAWSGYCARIILRIIGGRLQSVFRLLRNSYEDLSLIFYKISEENNFTEIRGYLYFYVSLRWCTYLLATTTRTTICGAKYREIRSVHHSSVADKWQHLSVSLTFPSQQTNYLFLRVQGISFISFHRFCWIFSEISGAISFLQCRTTISSGCVSNGAI